MWLIYVRTKYMRKVKYVMLAIDVPRANTQSPRAVENLLAYLAGGVVLRGSVLGLFAAPLVALLSAVALLSPLDVPTLGLQPRANPWLEMHIALAILGYGAFALAFATGAMYLVQEHQLKTHHLGPFFHRLPSIEQLNQINFRFLEEVAKRFPGDPAKPGQ